MASSNLDSADLKAVASGGLINEDVMQRIFDISAIPLPFSDMIGTSEVKNSYTEWTVDRLQDQDLNNAKVDGQDIDDDDTSTGSRVGNHCQISTKRVPVSSRADASDTIGRARELGYQIMMRQRELRRDIEGIMLTGQASVADDGNTTPGRLGGLQAWLSTNSLNGTTPGFSNGTVGAYAPGAAAQLSEVELRDMIEQIWVGGGDVSVIMSVPGVIKQLNQYMFTSSARIATLQADTSADNASTGLKAQGNVNVFISDHGNTLEIRSNRLQPGYTDSGTTTVAALYLLDPAYLSQGVLRGERTEPLAKTGLSEVRMMSKDYTLKVLNEEAHGVINDIDPTLPVVSSK
jgi:hypothetical protein